MSGPRYSSDITPGHQKIERDWALRRSELIMHVRVSSGRFHDRKRRLMQLDQRHQREGG